MKPPFRRLAVPLGALACAASLAACGGNTSGSTASPASGEGGNHRESSAPNSASEQRSGNGSSESAGSGSNDSAESRAEQGLPQRGKVSARSKSFQKYSAPGKLHLAEFGHEAKGSSRDEADEVVVAYVEAVGHEEWEAACRYLSATVKAQLGQPGATSASPGECPKLLAEASESELWRKMSHGSPIYAPEGIASFRIKEGGRAGGGAGFALFHGSDGEDHWLAIKVEEGRWRVLTPHPEPFQ